MMLLLRFHSPPLPFEQRKIMAEELTGTLVDLTGEPSPQIMIQFLPYSLDNLAVGGKLLHDTEGPLYLIELTGVHANPAFMGVLEQALRSQCVELLGIPSSESERVQIDFNAPGQAPRPRPVEPTRLASLTKP